MESIIIESMQGWLSIQAILLLSSELLAIFPNRYRHAARQVWPLEDQRIRYPVWLLTVWQIL